MKIKLNQIFSILFWYSCNWSKSVGSPNSFRANLSSLSNWVISSNDGLSSGDWFQQWSDDSILMEFQF